MKYPFLASQYNNTYPPIVYVPTKKQLRVQWVVSMVFSTPQVGMWGSHHLFWALRCDDPRSLQCSGARDNYPMYKYRGLTS